MLQPLIRARRLGVTLLALGVIACNAPNEAGTFAKVFEFELPEGAPVEERGDSVESNSVYTARLTPSQFEEVKLRTRSAGYSEWRMMEEGETYGQNDFFIESTGAKRVLKAVRRTNGGDVFSLFYIQADEELSAVAFYN